VGIDESEKDMVKVIQKANDLGAKTHLFSFFPEEGSILKDQLQPSYGNYRRIQLARYIINEGSGSYNNMKFNDNDQLIDFGIDTEEIIKNGEAFMTSGCAGSDGKVACNRPFGNERPSKPIRNFPFLPDDSDIELIKEQLSNYSL
jgi:biotin synthase